MPEICRFYGIVIRMFYKDHNPPHFHIEYQEYEATIDIETLKAGWSKVRCHEEH